MTKVRTKSLQMIMSKENFEMSSPSLTNQTDYRKHLGVRQTKLGKWGAAIRHPVTKVSVWLGSFSTPKEAADAYVKKKMEYQSLEVHKIQDSMNTKSGIQGAKIQDPGIYESVCLGTCSSAEDDANANAYARTMFEFDSVVTDATVDETEDALNGKTCQAKFMDQVEMNCKESKVHVREDVIAHSSKMTNQRTVDLAEAVGNTDVAIRAKRLNGSGSIYRNKSGMWRAQIYYRKSKVHVGSYSTYEEAESAIYKKRQELDSVARVEVVAKELVNGQLTCNQNPENQVGIIIPCVEENFAQVIGNTDVAISAKRLHGSGSISRKKSGRWRARISKVHVGSYSTYEGAESAIHKKRLELDSLARVEAVAKELVNGQLTCNQNPENQVGIISPCVEENFAQVVGNTNVAISAKRLHGSGSISRKKSGRWRARISKVHVGSYSTYEEAESAIHKKRQELDSVARVEAVAKELVNGQLTCNQNPENQVGIISPCGEENFAQVVGKTDVAISEKRLHGSGSISQKKSGRWRARISEVHVGIYSTYEEAEAAIHKKRQELDLVAHVEALAKEPVNGQLMFNQNPEKQVDIIRPCSEVHLAQVVSDNNVAIRVKRLPGSGSITRTKAGRWQAQAYNRKSKIYLGTYSTYEEAEAAIHKKRQDLDSVAHVEVVAKEHKTTTKQSVALIESMNGVVTCNQEPEKQLSVNRPRGVYQRKSGRWYAEIKNPMTKWRGSVGTYDTAEQALEVLNRKRREFALLKSAEKKCKQSIVVAEEDLQAHNGTITNYNVGLIEWKGDETALATKSQDIECGDCNANVDDIQVPNSSFLSNDEFDSGIIDAYGQLVGEFSRLDDDLWLVESLNDGDGNLN